MKIALIDHNYPVNSPFLLNKYNGLNERLQVHLFHYGKQKKKGLIKNTALLPNKLVKAFTWLYSYLVNPVKMSVWLFKAYQYKKWYGFKFIFTHYPILIYKPSIIHFEFGTLAINKMLFKVLIPAKVVVSFRGYDLNYYKLNRADVYHEVWDKTDAFHFLGHDLYQRAIKRGYSNTKSNYFISPAIDLELFKPDKQLALKTNYSIHIISTGRLVWKKGYEYAISAMGKLKDAGYPFHYTIIGEGPMQQALTFQIHQLGLQKEVSLVGAKNQQEVKMLLQEADIFLHPAVSEGFCNAVVEAQAMGRPVVCTNADGLSENIDDTNTGYVIPIYDAKAITDNIIKLMNSPNLRLKMGLNGMERAEKRYNLSDQIMNLEKMYNSLVNPTTI